MHIAYWFAERNKRSKSYKVWENDIGENRVEEGYKAPPQVIYCGPSNKAVDVVTGMLYLIHNRPPLFYDLERHWARSIKSKFPQNLVHNRKERTFSGKRREFRKLLHYRSANYLTEIFGNSGK